MFAMLWNVLTRCSIKSPC